LVLVERSATLLQLIFREVAVLELALDVATETQA
jgi:hypothetical protein